nr:MFS transporter [Amycolatopsis benzoatilytica]
MVAERGEAVRLVRQLARDPSFRRLLLTRFAAQWGDGVYRAGLAGAVLFNPERATDPLAIAGGFAALLLPYSLVGPFAGALLDRWDRRRVLMLANLARVVAIVASVVAVAAGVGGLELFSLALVAEGISRFIGSGLSAALPHVVPGEAVVSGNAVAATLGPAIAVVGGGCAIGLRAVFGSGDVGSAETTAFAIAGAVLSAFFAQRFAKGVLGPTVVDEPANPLVAVARGLADGAKHAWRAPSVSAGFVALFAHRAAYGISLLVSVLLMRNYFADDGVFRAGLPGLGQLVGAAGAGILVAGFFAARLIRRFGRDRTVLAALGLSAVAQGALGVPMLLPLALVASFLIMGTGQVLKLCVDSSVQLDVADEARGRVFALYDTLFNITQVAAVSVAAIFVPENGHSPAVLAAATGLYLVGGAGYLLAWRRRGDSLPQTVAGKRG